MATTAGTRSDTRSFGHPLGLVTLYGIGLALAAATLPATRAFRPQAMALWYFGTIGGVIWGLAALFLLVAPWIQRRIAKGGKEAPTATSH